MIKFLRLVWPLLQAGARRRVRINMAIAMVLAVLEGAALFALLPLLSILTAPNLRPTSRLATKLIQLVGGGDPRSLALELGVITLVLYAVKDVAAIVVARWSNRFLLAEEARLARALIRLYLRAPYRDISRRNTSEYIRTLNGSIRVTFNSGLTSATSGIGDVVSVLFVAAALVIISPSVAITASIYFGVVGVAYHAILRRGVVTSARKLHEAQAQDFRLVRQSLTALREIKVRGKESFYEEQVYQVRRTMAPAYLTSAMLNVLPRYVLELAMLGAAATIAAVSYSTQPLTTATATLGLFIAGAFRLLGPMSKVLYGTTAVKSALPALEQILTDFATFAPEVVGSADMPDRLAEPGAEVTAEIDAALHGAGDAAVGTGLSPAGPRVPVIEVSDLSFSYTPGTPVLSQVSFRIEPGESIGVAGASGAGKSTLLDILLGLLPPDSGAVMIDGRPLTEVLGAWRRMVGYVPQSVTLFDDTIAANVALGVAAGDIDREEVARALRLAQLDEVVAELDLGTETLVGEQGLRLSGGQRQRLGIARALYHRPTVLLFDEATSALDNQTEFRLTEVFESLRGQVTTITIAHRLSTIRRCDRVFLLDAGRLAASGNFTDLAVSNPEFARLVELADLSA